MADWKSFDPPSTHSFWCGVSPCAFQRLQHNLEPISSNVRPLQHFQFRLWPCFFLFLLLKSLRLKSSIWSWFSRLLIFSGHTMKLSFSKNKHDYKFRGAPRSASSHVFSANWTGVAWKADIHFIKTRMAIKKTMKPAFEYFSIKPIGLRVMPNSCG